MSAVADIPQLTRSLVALVDEGDEFDDRDQHAFDSFATTYRLYCERSAKIVLDDLEGYPDVTHLIAIEQAETALDIEPYQCRDTLRYYRDWAYRYGAKQADPVELPPNEYRADSLSIIQRHAEDLIKSEMATVNDMALAFRLADEYCDERDDTDAALEDAPLLVFFDRVHEQVADLAEMKQPDLNWNMFGGWLDVGRRMANERTHESLGRRKGRREIIEELRTTDLSLNEWLEENA